MKKLISSLKKFIEKNICIYIWKIFWRKLQKEFREASGQKVIPKVKDDTSGKQQSNTILVEGKRLIQDAMNSGFYPKTFVFSRVNQLVDFKFDKSKEMNMYQIPYRSVELWSEMPVGHPGFMGEKISSF